MSISGKNTSVMEKVRRKSVFLTFAHFCCILSLSCSTKLRAAVGGGGGGGGYPPNVRSTGLVQPGLGGHHHHRHHFNHHHHHHHHHGFVQPGLAGLSAGHQTGLGSDGLSYERSPGDTNNSESGDSQSMPASVTSLSE